MNEDPRYSMNPNYVFMAQQKAETHAIENKINMAMSHGSLEVVDSETKLTPSKDAYSIFQCIPGTPAYWKQFRSELIARMEQLGPFHIFFTLSCAEMRWEYFLAEVLKVVEKNIKVVYVLDEHGKWDGNAETLMINDDNIDNDEKSLNINDYMEAYLKRKKLSKTDFLKDHFILISRLFDKRAKDFLNTVMKNRGIQDYVYRVEFQMRGLPHIHGVAWLEDKHVQNCLDPDGLFTTDVKKEKNVIDLVDSWISCSLNSGKFTSKKFPSQSLVLHFN